MQGETVAAIDLSTRAAEQLVALRRGILDLDRVRALPELFARAELVLASADGDLPAGAALLREHAVLKEAADAAVAGGDRARAHAALTAVRESELRITLEALGPGTAASIVADVGRAIGDLKGSAPAAEPRLRRMLKAASDLHYRASSALRAGDGIAALDLASYAAGLVNAFRLATARF
ncbi:MAG: hypothetical protein FIB01_04260 [Gemmatimonadetes bacterium]|nr:hypothetical protein [Gemmatimonadota bacterium]